MEMKQVALSAYTKNIVCKRYTLFIANEGPVSNNPFYNTGVIHETLDKDTICNNRSKLKIERNGIMDCLIFSPSVQSVFLSCLV
jgi:hypothetical protein